MPRLPLQMSALRKCALSIAAAAAAAGAGAPAMAGGGYVNFGYHTGFKGGHYYPARYYGHRGYYGRRHYRHHRRYHRGGGGGKAAAIALGVIGGAIILNELAEDRARRRHYDDRYYDRGRYYDPYSRRSYYQYGYDGLNAPAPPSPGSPEPRGFETPTTPPSGGDDLDIMLDGGPNEGVRVSSSLAYQACIRRVRTALSERGYILSAPFEPETAEDIGGAWKMTATVLAQRGADDWSRAMYCEADEDRVYLVELI